ncbi:retrovirus-related pol polyprotein from transposon TNT 1-94 [Tanacetum coccineum]|uniref:Retrovirus-related pol polyprotein from transposon TNT 1-94 n=1 Tax=Tanacetum coccineum TaxID=301880 RepID=A0ABQ5A4Z1_9ASTR
MVLTTQKNKVKARPRKVKSSLKNKNCVVEPKGTAHVQNSKLNANFELKCVKCNGCMLSDNHDLCVLDFINNVNARNACPLTRITITTEVPRWKPPALENETPKHVVTLVYSRKPRKSKTNVPISKSKVVQIVLWYLDSGFSKHITGDRSQLTNFVNKFLGTVKFRNDHVAKILGYGDYQFGNVMISRVYYVEGLGHNLFSIGQFCDSNLEVAFCQHTCFIRNLEGIDLLTGSRGNNLYTMSLRDMMTSSRICLLSKALKTNKKKPHKPKCEDINQEKLYLLHMDLCGPMRVASVDGKKYILVIVDDYSRFTWVKFLRSKAKAPDFIIKFLKMIQVRLQVTIRRIRTNNGLNLLIKLYVNIMRRLTSLMKHLLLALHNKMVSLKNDILFQLMFDELLTPLPSVDIPAPEVIAPIDEVVAPVPAVSTGSPSSTTVDQDAPSPIAHMGNDPYFGILILKIPFDQSSSSDSIHTIVHPDHQISKHNSKWNKDHPLENIIGKLNRPVSTRLQLHKQTLFCYYDAFLSAVEPKTYKDALTQSCWIEAMQEELNEFECLEVWELIP